LRGKNAQVFSVLLAAFGCRSRDKYCESAISLVYLLAKELPKITCHHSSSGAYSLTPQAEEG